MAVKSPCIMCRSSTQSLQHFPALGLDFIFIESIFSTILYAFLSVLPELCKSNIKFSLNMCLNLHVICVTHIDWSNLADLLTLWLSAAQPVTPLYTTYDMEKCPVHAWNECVMTGLSSIENDLYRSRQEVKKQQLTLMDMWKKCI